MTPGSAGDRLMCARVSRRSSAVTPGSAGDRLMCVRVSRRSSAVTPGSAGYRLMCVRVSRRPSAVTTGSAESDVLKLTSSLNLLLSLRTLQLTFQYINVTIALGYEN